MDTIGSFWAPFGQHLVKMDGIGSFCIPFGPVFCLGPVQWTNNLLAKAIGCSLSSMTHNIFLKVTMENYFIYVVQTNFDIRNPISSFLNETISVEPEEKTNILCESICKFLFSYFLNGDYTVALFSLDSLLQKSIIFSDMFWLRFLCIFFKCWAFLLTSSIFFLSWQDQTLLEWILWRVTVYRINILWRKVSEVRVEWGVPH